jgi:hypothetical protein
MIDTFYYGGSNCEIVISIFGKNLSIGGMSVYHSFNFFISNNFVNFIDWRLKRNWA